MFAAQALVVVTTQILVVVSYFLYARDRFKVPYSPEQYNSTLVYTRVWAWVTEYMQVSMLVNTMLCLNNRYLHIFSHPPPYPSSI